MFNLRMPPAMKARLKASAASAGRSMTAHALMLLVDGMDACDRAARPAVRALDPALREPASPLYRDDEAALLAAYQALPANKRALALAVLKLVA